MGLGHQPLQHDDRVTAGSAHDPRSPIATVAGHGNRAPRSTDRPLARGERPIGSRCFRASDTQLADRSDRYCSSRASVSSRAVATPAYQWSSGRLAPRRVPAAARIRPTQQRAPHRGERCRRLFPWRSSGLHLRFRWSSRAGVCGSERERPGGSVCLEVGSAGAASAAAVLWRERRGPWRFCGLGCGQEPSQRRWRSWVGDTPVWRLTRREKW